MQRSILHFCYQNKNHKEIESLNIVKLQRKKIQINRNDEINNLQNALNFGDINTILEFYFDQEEGTGLGPTLEFYNILAQQFKNPSNKLLKITQNDDYFPFFMNYNFEKDTKMIQNQLQLYKLIGQTIARVILDERTIDLPLNPLFFDFVLNRPINVYDFMSIDKDFVQLIKDLQQIIEQKQKIGQNIQEKEQLNYRGTKIEDLAMTFVLPIQTDIDLIENGKNINISLDNLDQYVYKIQQYVLQDSIIHQINAFRQGFNSVFNVEKLNIFKSQELINMYCGNQYEPWVLQDLLQNIVPAHGFTIHSKTFIDLLQIMTELNNDQQSLFLRFITGCSRLPYGGFIIIYTGFKNLYPKLTVVKKIQEQKKVDDVLPSVMTCQNYLKIPEYSSKLIFKQKLIYAMNEGQNNFSLS